jgi:predicted nucleotide-binding protein
MGRKAGSKNRNYPSMNLEEALVVATAIQDDASGMPVSKFTLAELLDRSPSSSDFREMLLASRAYGLTGGGVNADRFELTSLGVAATGGDEMARAEAKRKSVLNIEPFRIFLTAYSGKKVPSATAMKEFLVTSADVPTERAYDCVEHLLADARTAGLLRVLKGSEYVELSGVRGSEAEYEAIEEDEPEDVGGADVDGRVALPRDNSDANAPDDAARKVFIAHGKNRNPLDQLKKMLDQFKVKYAVAVDEPNRGRPVSAKVASLMRDECSSAIFIFTADERFLREDEHGATTEVWRPSENVVYELGAAAVLYDRRIVIFKERGVTFPSDFSDLGYIEFEAEHLAEKMGDLFAELVSLDVLEVRAKT